MDEPLKNIASSLNDLKLITSTQVDLSYFNSLAAEVFSNPSMYVNIQSDVQFINQMGGQLFNYFNSTEVSIQKIWYVAFASGLSQSITDANNLITQIPAGSPTGPDLTTVLNTFVADCQAIQKIFPQGESNP